MSIAGGLPLAIARAQIHRCQSLQIFSKNASQWRARPLPPSEISAFRKATLETGIAPIVAHASYLINIATPNPALRAQSIAALGEEVDRAEALGLLGVVLHPGARLATPVDEALELVSAALDQVLKARRRGKTMILLEHTAGQGSTMGSHVRGDRRDARRSQEQQTPWGVPRHLSPARLGLRLVQRRRLSRDIRAHSIS